MQPTEFPYNFSLREHLRRAAGQAVPRLSWVSPEAAGMAAWRVELRTALAAAVGVTSRSAPPEVRLLDQEQAGGITRSRLALQVTPDLSVPAYALSPVGRETPPVLLCLARDPAGKAALVGELADPHAPGRPTGLAARLCAAGFFVLVPDLPGGGERAEDPPALDATLRARGDSLAAWEVREALTYLAYLRARPETPPGQVGIVATGEALLLGLLAAHLDAGVKAVAVAGDLRSWAARLVASNALTGPGGGAPEQFLPGLAALADLPDLAGLVAPRPLLLAGTGAEPEARTVRLTEQIFDLSGHAPRLEVHTQTGGEAEFAALAADFLAVWLTAAISDLPSSDPPEDGFPPLAPRL
ncbi:MAG TPA: hypothetical protein VGM19_10695 [Armatimonadota bacterium]|jgi:hypothetical protein